jgi:hypothetical protein
LRGGCPAVYPPAVLAALLAAALAAVPAEAAIAGALASAPAGAARAAAATRPLLGAPYVLSPLGEGSGRDPDPRFRLDAFDCMTFVETALALGSAANLDEARAALDDVRYGTGAPAWVTRNHEVLSQWIPRNVEKGWIRPWPVAPPGGGAPHVAAKEYTAESWTAVRAAGRLLPGLPAARLPLGRFEVPLVLPGEVAAAAAKLPEGAVVFVIRADAPERPTRVTHAGLVVHRADGVPLVRHATSTRGVARVIEEPLARFLAREQAAFPRWPVEGLAFYAVTDASARVRSLAEPAAPVGPPAPAATPALTSAPAPAGAATPAAEPASPTALTARAAPAAALEPAPAASTDPASLPSTGAAPGAAPPAAAPPAAEVPAAPPPPAEAPPARL